MIPILYSENETSFTTNGLGRLSDAIKCVVKEERNGIYECELPEGMTNVIFCRMNPEYTTLSWDVDNNEVVEDHVWNQTGDLELEGNHFTINKWDNGVDGKSVGVWSTK